MSNLVKLGGSEDSSFPEISRLVNNCNSKSAFGNPKTNNLLEERSTFFRFFSFEMDEGNPFKLFELHDNSLKEFISPKSEGNSVNLFPLKFNFSAVLHFPFQTKIEKNWKKKRF